MATHIAGLSWYGKKNIVKVGYIYGALTLDDDGYHYVDGVDTLYDSTTGNFFNYPTRELDDSIGAKRVYTDPDITYHRILVDFDFFVLKALSVLNVTEKPAFTRMGTEFNFMEKRYSVIPYFAMTNDVEGTEDFSIYQGGVRQSFESDQFKKRIFKSNYFKLSALKNLWKITFDMNYSHIPGTTITDGREDFYVDLTIDLALLSMFAWWSNENGVGGATTGFSLT